MANVLAAEKRLEVLAALVNGCSIRAASRMTDVHQDTIGRFGAAVGEGCQRLHDRIARDMTCPLVDLDEQHSWCGVREIHLDPAKHDRTMLGEQWTWAAICRTSKLTIAWYVGKRDQVSADILVADVRARLLVMPTIVSDGLNMYPKPIGTHFGYGIDYVQTVKNSKKRSERTPEADKAAAEQGAKAAAEQRAKFIDKRIVFGAPNLDKATSGARSRGHQAHVD